VGVLTAQGRLHIFLCFNFEQKNDKEQIMSRKREDELRLSDGDIYKAIEKMLKQEGYTKDPKKSEYLTKEDVKAVFDVFARIVLRGVKNNLIVSLPNLGLFSKKHRKGWKGRTLKVNSVPFTKSEQVEKKIETKPDYSVIDFKVKPKLQTAFIESTREG
jgi:nucleoid DNA-binding protein